MKPPEKKYWFPAKTYGYGWGPPSSWQGWIVFLAYLAVFVPAIIWLNANPTPIRVAVAMPTILLATAVMISICYIKGEPPAWRWGKKPGEDGK